MNANSTRHADDLNSSQGLEVRDTVAGNSQSADEIENDGGRKVRCATNLPCVALIRRMVTSMYAQPQRAKGLLDHSSTGRL